MIDAVLNTIRRCVPRSVFSSLQPIYHYFLALFGALLYRSPSKNLYVVAVTGTKGKTTVTELLACILEEAGHTVALSNTIHFKIGTRETRNLYKMTMPGRFFMQKFLRRAVSEGCTHAVIEMTSEGARFFRHKWIYLDALIFTNLSPEHIESHGSFENYLAAKLMIRDALERSWKRNKIVVANTDNSYGEQFLNAPSAKQIPFSLRDAKPYTVDESGIIFTFQNTSLHSPLTGTFNLENILAAGIFARHIGIDTSTLKRALSRCGSIRGRVEHIHVPGQTFDVVVDYAHTPDSLKKLYEAFPGKRKICVLGNTGGGRDRWKRPEMARCAEAYCSNVILTNEDPYDEDPRAILEEMKNGMVREPMLILDRREAVKRAIAQAHEGDVVLITGKGTDPYIMGPSNTKTPWSDADVVREELELRKTQSAL